MKLEQVIKGYKDSRCVRIVYNGVNKCEWNGQGIAHVIDRYCPELFDHEVINTSVNYQGVRIIEVSSERVADKIDRLEYECAKAFTNVIAQKKTTQSGAELFLSRIKELVKLTGFDFIFVTSFIIEKSAILYKQLTRA